MTGDEQQPIGGNVAGATTPTPTPNGTGNPTDTVEYWKAQAESFESRYKGASTKINEYDKSVKTWQQKYAEKEAEAEGLRASSTNDLTEVKSKAQTLEQQLAEQSKKLSKYELKDKVRDLVYTDDFKDLATDFEMDKIFQFGLLTAAETLDEAALKAELGKSLTLRKGRQAAAAESATSGASSAAPASGTTTGATADQVIKQIRELPINDPKRSELMKKWQAMLDKENA